MKSPKLFFTILFLFITSHLAFAGSGQNDNLNSLGNLAFSFAPIAVFLILLFLLLRRQNKSPLAKLQRKNIERHIQHMQRMEDLWERFVTAIEKFNKPDA